MRGLRGSCRTARDTGQLSDKCQMLGPSAEVKFSPLTSHPAENPGLVHPFSNQEEAVLATQQHRFHGAISKLARKAAFRANRPGAIGSLLDVRNFSITPSTK